jgi:hypothetical protein
MWRTLMSAEPTATCAEEIDSADLGDSRSMAAALARETAPKRLPGAPIHARLTAGRAAEELG